MVIKSEKKSKKKFGMKQKCFVNPNAKTTRIRRPRLFNHFRHIGANNWLPIPKHRYREFLADIDAVAKLHAEGKQPVDEFMFDKYYEEPGKVYKAKPFANWKELLHEMNEKEAAKARANLMKKAYIKEKDICL